MNDPIWQKVYELTKGYPPTFNAAAVAELVEKAWRMGFDLVQAPTGSDLYNVAMQARAVMFSNAAPSVESNTGQSKNVF